MPQDSLLEHLDEYPPQLQTQLRWILSRLDGHDAQFKGTETRFDDGDKRVLELASVDAKSREDRSQIRYRLEQVELTLKKFQETQEKDALPLIKEIHDTTRLAQEQAADLLDLRKTQKEDLEQMRISHKEQLDELKRAQEGQMRQLQKALKKVTKAQRNQTQRFVKMAALVLGIGVSLTVVAQFVAQHLVFH